MARHARLNMTMILCLLTVAGWAEYATPEQTGFHHCVLIYDGDARGPEGFLPYVAHLNGAGEPDQWLFDAFLLCAHQGGPSTGASYHDGPTNREDWEALQDGWSVEGRGLRALQEAVRQAEATLGEREQPVEVVLTIPYPSAQQTAFGDVDGDGANEDLSREEARAAAAEWYIERALAQWEALRTSGLHLWGFYWTHEAAGAKDVEVVQGVARLVHERGHRFLWIPWFQAPGFRQWRELGFDTAILQPNYAFLSDHLGKVRSDRLVETAALAKGLGMGVEMEVGYGPERDLREREIFREYLAFGAPDRCGYQAAAQAYFQSVEVFTNLLHAEDPDARRVYDELAAYVSGEAVERPGALQGARVSLNGTPLATGAAETAGVPVNVNGAMLTIELPEPRAVGEVELGCVRGEAGWSGVVATEVRGDEGEWRPGGWVSAIVRARSEDGGLMSVIAAPVFAEDIAAVRVRADGSGTDGELMVNEVTVTCGPPRLDWREPNLAYGRPYRVEPDPERRYPDRGGMLTDGEISTEGWAQGRSVGWWGATLVVWLDLGETRDVERVVAHCDGGGQAAVNFPEWVRVDLSDAEPAAPPAAWGLGAPPARPTGTATRDAAQVRLDGERQAGDGTRTSWGRCELELGGRRGRFVTLHFRHSGWLMLSEVEVWAQGTNVARGARYACAPSPTEKEAERYADEGVRLTDGCVARGFEPRRVAGWAKAEAVVLTVDLGAARPVAEVIVHTL
ncbi:MAG: DUF4855 domain-containing protein, partial [Armatimonadetes bacterium]|nr:DUF4855 domain-containing protein [Armatimonadota bacterium]